MKKILVIGRCWKFVDFLIPTLKSIYDYHDNVDIVVIDNLSSRSININTYCDILLSSKKIETFIAMDDNYYGNVWCINRYLLHMYDKYEYICLTDLDMEIVNPQKNWLGKLSKILDTNSYIGAVSVDFEKMENLPWHHDFSIDHPELKLPHEDFWSMNTDGWFYMTRKNQFVDFVAKNMDQSGPGMHGYNRFCTEKGLLVGRTSIYAKHFGWFRIFDEWSASFTECGVQFDDKNYQQKNMEYLALQGNWHGGVRIPDKNSYKIYNAEI